MRIAPEPGTASPFPILPMIVILIFLGTIAIGPVHAHIYTISASVASENKDGPEQNILTAIAARLDAKIVFQYAPFKRRLLMLKNGDVDMVCGILKRPEREAYIHFILPPYKKRSDTIFLISKGSSIRIKSYEDLKGLKIGVIRGSKYFIQFDDDTTLHKEIGHQATANLKKLILGRLDTMIIHEAAGIGLIHKLEISDQVKQASYRFSRNKSVYIGISKNSHLMENIREVEPIIQSMIESGQISDILKAYYTSRGLSIPAF